MQNDKNNVAEKIWKDTDLIGLTVTLKSKTGRSFNAKGVKITRNNLEYFVPETQKGREAKRELEKSGFKIIAESRLGISILGQKKLIEEFFKTKVDIQTASLKHGKRTFKLRMPKGRLTIPKGLTRMIDRVKFEQYPIPLEPATPPDVDYYHLNVPDDIVNMLNASALHSCGYDGSGIKLCMVDDGFFEHAYYADKGYNITLIPVGLDSMPDGKGHGTTIASNALAVAPGVEFIFLNNQILIFSIVTAAFRRAKEENPDIITCSWGLSSYDEDLAWEIADAVNNGIIVTFACGNEGPVLFPGCMDEVISVGGVFPEEEGGFHAATYASSGECNDNPGRQCPDVCGLVGDDPHGVLIMMPTVPGGSYDEIFADDDNTADNDGWLVASGTSSAAPQVAGVVALMLQCEPTFLPDDVKTILQVTATDITEGNSASGQAAGPGVDLATGYGLVNAQAAVEESGCPCSTNGWVPIECKVPCFYCQTSVELTPCFCMTSCVSSCTISFEGGCLSSCVVTRQGPGGCGPWSLIAAEFPWEMRRRFERYLRINPITRERMMRMIASRSMGVHTRRLTQTKKSTRIPYQTRKPGRRLFPDARPCRFCEP